MAVRARPVAAPVWLAGTAALGLVGFFVLGTVAALVLRAEAGHGLGPADWSAIRFTLLQATLSAAFSVAIAIPAARAIARRNFLGRRALVALLGAPFLLPAVVAVFGIIAVWGRSGPLSRLIEAAGGPGLDIYGLVGVVLAHVFFNLPLVTRLILQGWVSIPAEQFRLAAQLGFGPGDIFRRIEVPMLREVVPGAFVLVFLLCMTSFAVALTVGGGPRATTIELAIYQAIRFDFDLGRAALLALIQLGLCAVITALALVLSAEASFGAGLGRPVRRWDTGGTGMRLLDTAVLVALTAFVAAPLLTILLRGVPGILSGLPDGIWLAALRSLAIALAATVAALIMGVGLAALIDARRARGGGKLMETFALLTLSASPMVIGTGLFIIIHPLADPFALALLVTAAVNAVMALPFVLRALLPGLAALRIADARLADSLGISGAARFRLVLWPRLRRPLCFAAGLSAALSMGDLGVVALFAPPDFATLPLLMQRLMGSYRMQDAAAVAVVLVLLTFTLFVAFDRGGRPRAQA